MTNASRTASVAWRQLGALLRQARVRRGLTMDACAGRLGINYQQIHKYEKGVNRIPADRLFLLADELGIDLATLRQVLIARIEPPPSDATSRARDRVTATLASLDEPDLMVVQAAASALAINRHRQAKA